MLEMEGGLIAARGEAGMMKYSMEEVRAASDAVRKSTGQIVVDPSLLADITEVSSVLKDADKAVYIGHKGIESNLSPTAIHDIILSQIFS